MILKEGRKSRMSGELVRLIAHGNIWIREWTDLGTRLSMVLVLQQEFSRVVGGGGYYSSWS